MIYELPDQDLYPVVRYPKPPRPSLVTVMDAWQEVAEATVAAERAWSEANRLANVARAADERVREATEAAQGIEQTVRASLLESCRER